MTLDNLILSIINLLYAKEFQSWNVGGFVGHDSAVYRHKEKSRSTHRARWDTAIFILETKLKLKTPKNYSNAIPA